MRETTLVREHVRRFNEGVRSGDFEPMLQQFAEDAVVSFSGIPVGPFVGKPAIAAAYRRQPPDDEIDVRSIGVEGGEIVVPFRWCRTPSMGGTMRFQERKGQIASLLIEYGAIE